MSKNRQLNNLEKALIDGPILPKEVSREEYDRVINYLITIGFFNDFIE